MLPGQRYAASLPANHPIPGGQASKCEEMDSIDGQSLLRRKQDGTGANYSPWAKRTSQDG